MAIQSENNVLSSLFMKMLVLYLVVFPIFFRAFPVTCSIFSWMKVPVPSLYIALTALVAVMANYASFKVVYGVSFSEDVHRVGEMMESILEFCLLIIAVESLPVRGSNRSICSLGK